MQDARLAIERMLAVRSDNQVQNVCSDRSAESNLIWALRWALRSPPQTRIIQTFASLGWSKLWKKVCVREWCRYEEGPHSPVFLCDRIVV
jgi:hypothetical protein